MLLILWTNVSVNCTGVQLFPLNTPGSEESRSQNSSLDTEHTVNNSEHPSGTLSTTENKPLVDFPTEVVEKVDIGDSLPTIDYGISDSATLPDVFKRPVLLETLSWTPSFTFTTLNPWQLYKSKVNIKTKLDYFRNMRAQLRLKFVVNGNSFLYGRLMIAYHPMQVFLGPTSTARLMEDSQRLKTVINPTESDSIIMDLPFVFPRTAVAMPNPSFEVDTIGNLSIRTLNQLIHANGGSAQLSISIFAWCESMELGAPTRTGSVNEKEGVVHKIASKTAQVASLFNNVPTIGPLASAVEKSSMGLAKISKVFGWSKPEKETGEVMIPRPIDDIAQGDGKDAVSRLVLDSAQGLSIDPRLVGLNPADDLSISSFAKRESYVTTFQWNATQVTGAVVGNLLVNPLVNNVEGVNQYNVTPVGLAAMTHKYWTGNLVYRFEIVCSSFHKGRLLVQYDPNSIPPSDTNVNYTHVLDINECQNVCIDVGWARTSALLEVSDLDTDYFSPQTTGVQSLHNGNLTLSVLNELVTPSVTENPVYINVYVRAGDDFRVAAPSGRYIPRMCFTYGSIPDSVRMATAKSDTHMVKFMDSPTPGHLFHAYCGETTTSFRSLLKRYNYSFTSGVSIPTIATGSLVSFLWRWVSFPLAYNMSPAQVNDFYVPSQIIDKYNSGTTSNLLSILGACFLGYRGSIRWLVSFIPTGESDVDSMGLISRSPNEDNDDGFTRVAGQELTTSYSDRIAPEEDSHFGSVYFDTRRNRTYKIEIPFYSELNFSTFNSIVLSTVPNIGTPESVSVAGTQKPDRILSHQVAGLTGYCATGEDFSFVWFQRIPTFVLVDYTLV